MFEPARCLTLTVYGTLLGMVMLTAMAPVAVSTYRPITPTIPAEEATAKRRQRVRLLCGCSPVARTGLDAELAQGSHHLEVGDALCHHGRAARLRERHDRSHRGSRTGLADALRQAARDLDVLGVG